MASPLAQQIDHVRTLLRALEPDSDAEFSPFIDTGTDLAAEAAPALRRTFEVRPAADGSLTLERFGTSHRQALARFEVVFWSDTYADRDRGWQALAEDTDSIVALVEAPGSRVSASVQQVRHVASRLDAGDSAHTAAAVITFECTYIHEI